VYAGTAAPAHARNGATRDLGAPDRLYAPLIMPAIVSGMLLSFIVMLGIYGIPAVLGAPINLSALTRSAARR
jgi:ABC-type spermidine/putrescine transport system permease subunit I